MAASVPFAEDDVVNGLAEPSSLPYSTLLTLPPRGIVIVATFIAVDTQFPGSTLYPRARCRRIGEATPYIENGTQIRPDQPLGQYQLRAAVSGWNVEVNAYFGTPRPSARLLDAAQRQLDRLLTRPAPTPKRFRRRRNAPRRLRRLARPHVHVHARVSWAGTASRPASTAGRSRRGRMARPAFAAIGTSARGAAASAVENNVAWISAGRPSAEASVASGYMSVHLPVPHLGDGRGQPRPLPRVVGEGAYRLAGARGPVGDRLRSAARLRDAAAGARPRARDPAKRGDAEVLPDIPADDDARKGRRDRGQHAVGEAARLRAGARVGSARLFAAKDCVED